jgi:CRP-like cAMP-binding protein
MATYSATHTYSRGIELFRQGSALDEVFHVVSGTVKLTQIDSNGSESIVGLALPGSWLGTAAVIANTVAPVSAVTCSVAVLGRCLAATFRRLLHEDWQMSWQIHEAHSRDLCRQTNRIGQLCSLTSRERLRSTLLLFARMSAPSVAETKRRFRLPIQRWELAEFIGVTPEHLSRLLKEVEHEGFVRRERGWLVVQDPELTNIKDPPPSLG